MMQYLFDIVIIMMQYLFDIWIYSCHVTLPFQINNNVLIVLGR